MRKTVYYSGIPGVHWGMWDLDRNCWMPNIREDTPMLAQARLYQIFGAEAKRLRCEPRQARRAGQ